MTTWVNGVEQGGGALPAPVRLARRTVADTDTTVTTADTLVAYTSLTAIRTATLPPNAAAATVFTIADETGTAALHVIQVAAPAGKSILFAGALVALVNIGADVAQSVTVYAVGNGNYEIVASS